jgi:hypothetical protein
MGCVKIFVEEACGTCMDVDVRDTYVEWLIGYLVRGIRKAERDELPIVEL